MNCTNCGWRIEGGTVVCPVCGAVDADATGGAERPPRPSHGPQQAPPYATPPPAPYPAGGLPGPGTSQWDATTVVVGVVAAMVIFSVVLVSLVHYFSGPFSEPEVEHITVNIAAPYVQELSGDGLVWWDAVLNINMITPRDARLSWDGLFLTVTSSTGSVLDGVTPLQPDLAGYDDGADGRIDVEFWYIETGGDPSLSAGDAIKITGMSLDYEGATALILYRGERIGSSTLPTDSP